MNNKLNSIYNQIKEKKINIREAAELLKTVSSQSDGEIIPSLNKINNRKEVLNRTGQIDVLR